MLNSEKVPEDFFATFDVRGAVILIAALLAVRKKIGVGFLYFLLLAQKKVAKKRAPRRGGSVFVA